MTASVRVCTFNVRYDDGTGGPESWPRRREAVLEAIRETDPGVVGLQEPLEHQLAYLQSRLPAFEWYAADRDGSERPERDPIGWHRKRFEAVERETRWLSPTPERRESVGWDAARSRFVTRVTLRDRTEGTTLTVSNVHLDHEGERARRESARLLAEWVADDAHPVVLADLNATPDDDAYERLVEGSNGSLRDARLAATETSGPAGTFHAFTGQASDRLDYVLVGDGLAAIACETVTAAPGGRYPSDHFPVVADLRVA